MKYGRFILKKSVPQGCGSVEETIYMRNSGGLEDHSEIEYICGPVGRCFWRSEKLTVPLRWMVGTNWTLKDCMLQTNVLVTPQKLLLDEATVDSSVTPGELQHSMESAGKANLSGVDDILSDTSRPYGSRLQAASLMELKLLFNLAAPAALAYLTTYMMTFSTLKLCGHLGDQELDAAYNWVVCYFQIVTYTFMLGMSRAVETACGQAYGGQKYDVLVTQLKKSFILLTTAGLPFASIYIVSRPIMTFLGDESSWSSHFVYGLIPQIFAYAVYFPVQKFLQAQNIVAPSAYISVAARVWHLILSWVVIVKLQFGLLGASLMMSFSWWLLAVAQFVYILCCKYTWRQLSDFEEFGRLGELLGRSMFDSMAELFNFLFTVVPFMVAGILVKGEGTSTALGIWVYVIWLGFSSALSTRVSNGLGAGRPKAVQFSVAIAALGSLALSLVLAVFVVVSGSHLGYIFIEGSDAARILVELRPFLAFFILLSSVQPVLTGVAVGCGWQLYLTGIDIGCFYLIGVTLGCLLEFYFRYDTGFFSGIMICGFIRNVILSWMVYRADWSQEVKRVQNGLAALEGQK